MRFATLRACLEITKGLTWGINDNISGVDLGTRGSVTFVWRSDRDEGEKIHTWK